MSDIEQIEVQEWEEGFATFFVEGDVSVEEFRQMVRGYAGYDPADQEEVIVRGEVFRHDNTPEGFGAWYSRNEAEAEGEPGRTVPATYVESN